MDAEEFVQKQLPSLTDMHLVVLLAIGGFCCHL